MEKYKVSQVKSKTRVLILGSGPANYAIHSAKRREAEKLKYLGRFCYGDIVGPVARPDDLRVKKRIGFTIHPFLYHYGSAYLRVIKFFVLQIFMALRIHRKARKKYQVIISPNPLNTGLSAIILGRLTGAHTIIEVNGNFENAFSYGFEEKSSTNFQNLLKRKISDGLIRFVVKNASMVKLVYAKQLLPLHIDVNKADIHTRTFPNYVPIKRFIDHKKTDERYILLLGYPWYLKGVDILIRAFKKVHEAFPEYRLKVVGWCPKGKEFFEQIADGHPAIELMDPVYYDDVVQLMCACSMYVLASRTDSSPRVLREAMAAEKPIVAANIDGVPDLVHDGYNGLLFEKENVDDLADKMRQMLSNNELAIRLAKNGLEFVKQKLSEDCFAENYGEMIRATLYK